MKAWQSDKAWSDRFIPLITPILGAHLIGVATEEEDAHHNTDLIVLTMNAVRIGCRVRRHAYLANYGDEFTIRSGRTSGVKTELAKVIEGWGDYFFYAFSDPDETGFSQWTLGDLRVFRLWLARELIARHGVMPGMEQRNGDNSSSFHSFHVSDLPAAFVVGQGATTDLSARSTR